MTAPLCVADEIKVSEKSLAKEGLSITEIRLGRNEIEDILEFGDNRHTQSIRDALDARIPFYLNGTLIVPTGLENEFVVITKPKNES